MFMGVALDEVLDLLDLEAIEVNLFRGRSPETRTQRVFGGQVIGQALVAAYRTVEDRHCHSLHAYFLRPGDPKVPILYEVDRSRDGKSFTSRRVVAIQHGRPIFTLAASFQKFEEGLEHQIEMHAVPRPEDVQSDVELLEKIRDSIPEKMRPCLLGDRPIELRPVTPQPLLKPPKMAPYQDIWMKANGVLPDDVPLHQCVLAYASDMTLHDTATLPHGVNGWEAGVQMASLDHSMWFHRPFRADEYLMYAHDSPSSQNGRGFSRGNIYAQNGTLVCSVAQEGVLRVHDDD
jgi:acyl-CoA thioesterase-2